VVLLALGGTRLRAVVEDARFLAERGVPVLVAAGRPEVAQAASADPRVRVVQLPAAGRLGPWRLWRAARGGLRRLLPEAGRVSHLVVCDAPAVALAWHLARAEPDLPMSWCVVRSGSAARVREPVR
jgi:hypothetical protein